MNPSIPKALCILFSAAMTAQPLSATSMEEYLKRKKAGTLDLPESVRSQSLQAVTGNSLESAKSRATGAFVGGNQAPALTVGTGPLRDAVGRPTP